MKLTEDQNDALIKAVTKPVFDFSKTYLGPGCREYAALCDEITANVKIVLNIEE